MVFSNPKGILNFPHTKIINSRRLILIRISSNRMLLLQAKLVINGMLGVKSRVNRLVTVITPMDKIPTNKTLMGRTRLDKINGGNKQLGGTLVLLPTHGLRCPLTLNYPF